MAKFRTEPARGPLMRVSYAQSLFTPQEQLRDNGEKVQKYGCTLIVEKADPGAKWIAEQVKACVLGEWGEKGLDRLRAGVIRNPILDGAGKEAHDKEGAIRAGLGPEFLFIRPNSGMKPKVFDRAVLPIVSVEDCPSGSWGFPVLNCYAWHNPKNGDGVSFGISMFQLIRVATGDDILGGSTGGDPDKFFEKVEVPKDEGSKPSSAEDLFA